MRTAFLFLMFLSLHCAAQDKPDQLPPKEIKLSAETTAPLSIRFPFSSIKIIDNRFDTSKLGYEPVFLNGHDRKKRGMRIILKDGVTAALESYYNEFYQNVFSETETQLVIVLKKLWYSGVAGDKNAEMDIVKADKKRIYVYCKWEYYFKRGDTSCPFKRIDSVIYLAPHKVKRSFVPLHYVFDQIAFEQLLQGLIEIIDFDKAIARMNKLPQKTKQEVERFNTAYFNIPVLKDTGIAKGVFLTFEEFKKNSPSIVKFTEGDMKIKGRVHENYIEDENGVRITNYWGYNAGTGLKIGKYGNEKVYRTNNTFEFFALYQFLGLNNAPLATSAYKDYSYMIPYQLDMETGEIY